MNFFIVFYFEVNVVSFVGFSIEDGDVGDVQRCFFFDDIVLLVEYWIGFGVVFDQVYFVDDQMVVSENFQYFVMFVFVFVGNDDYFVVMMNFLYDGYFLQYFGGE